MTDFVHLHVHTEYSLLDGACRLGPLVARAAELGQKALAITDHGVMYGVIDFYKECKKQGIKPIIGCEAYVAPRTRHDKQHKVDSSPYHLVLLCKNEVGYQNLIKLISLGFTEGFYSRPRIDRELLEQHHEGLIALSACLAGEVPRALTAGEYERAKAVTEYYRDLFGPGNYYLELQNHGIAEQLHILPLLERLSRECAVPMAATNDSHYLQKEDAKMQQVLVCIATNRTIYDESDMEFATEEFYLKSGDEMAELFGVYEGAIENTVKIAEQCNLEFEFGKTKLPLFTAPGGVDNHTYFREKCREGLLAHYGQTPEPAVSDRLEFEISIIEKMGYVDYYLIVHDFIDYAKKKGIPVGPGRGSGAGSLAAYCIGITGIDPIQYNLLFERFLNPERISMPDFDIDFCYERRQEVIDYVIEKYGSDHVAQIITFGTMAARGAIRDVGRALGVSYATCDAIAKAVPFELGMTIEHGLEASVDFRKLYEADPKNRELIDMARKVEGMARHASTHAAGVVITRDAVDSYVPLAKNDASIVTQFTMTTLEELGLLKMDFLGLRNLTVISDVERMVQPEHPGFSIDKIPLDDPAVFEMFGKGHTNGVFQFESGGMKSVLMQLGPEHMEDLIAVISLYRPGPMESIPRYVRNRHNPELVTYKHPLLRPILDVTYGCIVYQEQVMQICRELAGYSYGRSDLVRRAMSKKKHDVMEKERHSFIYGGEDCPGCVKNGVPEHIASEIFDEMSSFASYAFNKSHAAAYALVSYQTAYLKLHHTREYMAALLTSILDSTSKVTEYIAECKKLGIDVLAPDVNESGAGFTVVGGRIRFGLLAVKNLGRALIAELVRERESGGPFADMLDFLTRMYGRDLNRRAVESLIKCGAFDCFGHTRAQMKEGFGSLMDNVEKDYRSNISGQLDLFGGGDGGAGRSSDYRLPDMQEYPLTQLLSMEKETCGLYLSGHPLSEHGDSVRRLRATEISTILNAEDMDGAEIRVVAIIQSKRTKTTRNNDMMAFLGLEDMSGAIEAIVFPRVYERYTANLAEGAVVAVRGKVKAGAEEEPQITCDAVLPIAEALANPEEFHAARPERREFRSRNGEDSLRQKPPASQYTPQYAPQQLRNGNGKAGKRGLYLKFPDEQSVLVEKASNVLCVFEGDMPVVFYFCDNKKYIQTPASYWTSPNPTSLRELSRLLGDENVVLVE